jgi:A/G-specific adenine glycosylase
MPARSALDPSVSARLLGWFDANRRDLPWRRTRDPWAVWVSEVMLQQTRVEAVRDTYERFVARFATPEDLARVDDDELMRAWRGLGYYRRARLLRDGAREVVAAHGGRVPDDPDALGRLPGIGGYTRGAIASIAFGHAEPAIDGNVERVVARHLGIDTNVKVAPARGAILEFVMRTMERARAGDFNQALMELGAIVCSPTSPRCQHCPVAVDCFARQAGTTDSVPVRKARRAVVPVSPRAVLVAGREGVLGVRVPENEPNAGQVELPGGGVLVDLDPADLASVLFDRYSARIEVGPPLASIRHAITHHRITFVVHSATATHRGRLQWFPVDESTPWTTPSRKVFEKAFQNGVSRRRSPPPPTSMPTTEDR